jgi:hypothetical protein
MRCLLAVACDARIRMNTHASLLPADACRRYGHHRMREGADSPLCLSTCCRAGVPCLRRGGTTRSPFHLRHTAVAGLALPRRSAPATPARCTPGPRAAMRAPRRRRRQSPATPGARGRSIPGLVRLERLLSMPAELWRVSEGLGFLQRPAASRFWSYLGSWLWPSYKEPVV